MVNFEIHRMSGFTENDEKDEVLYSIAIKDKKALNKILLYLLCKAMFSHENGDESEFKDTLSLYKSVSSFGKSYGRIIKRKGRQVPRKMLDTVICGMAIAERQFNDLFDSIVGKDRENMFVALDGFVKEMSLEIDLDTLLNDI